MIDADGVKSQVDRRIGGKEASWYVQGKEFSASTPCAAKDVALSRDVEFSCSREFVLNHSNDPNLLLRLNLHPSIFASFLYLTSFTTSSMQVFL